jgi:transposase
VCHLLPQSSHTLQTHPNARLTALGRELLVRRHIDEGIPLHELASQAGISLRSAYKWLARYRAGGTVALVDRRSVRRTQRRTLDPRQQQQARTLHHERCTMRRIAKDLTAPLSTVGRWLIAIGLGRLRNLQPTEPVRRYQ